MKDHVSVDHPVLKLATAWLAAVGVGSWSDFAALCAATYSVILIGEWLWKRVFRSWAERLGLVKPLLRRRTDKENE